MYVGEIMHTDLVTATPDTSLARATEILADKLIDHLLIIEKDGTLAGILSDRDLKLNCASPATTLSAHELNYLLEKVTIGSIMVKEIVTIPPDTTVERAADIMLESRISALPVMEGEKLVGIITTTDVTRVLLDAIGTSTDSTRFTILVKDRVGVMAEAARVLKESRVNIKSLVSWPVKRYADIFRLVMRVEAKDGEKAISALRGNGFKVLTEYVEDIDPYLPED
jgi:acetoin utilization protein AcuB